MRLTHRPSRKMRNLLGIVIGATIFVLSEGSLFQQPEARGLAPAPPVAPEKLLKKATVDGKYRMLLHQIKVEKDKETYHDYCDYGFRATNEYAGHTGLSKGWWVYVHPYWYIWRDLTKKNKEKRAWGPEQATGEPDTPAAGDCQTAWASKTADGDDEWLLLEYAEPVVPTKILVYETFNPGALYRVTVFKLDGKEEEVWKGDDPTTTDNSMGISEIPVKIDFKINRVKLYLKSKEVAGWNEIDAVGLKDKGMKTHWAVAAEASSTYAPDRKADEDVAEIYEDRIRKLEEENKKLKEENKKLKEMVEELKAKLKPEK